MCGGVCVYGDSPWGNCWVCVYGCVWGVYVYGDSPLGSCQVCVCVCVWGLTLGELSGVCVCVWGLTFGELLRVCVWGCVCMGTHLRGAVGGVCMCMGTHLWGAVEGVCVCVWGLTLGSCRGCVTRVGVAGVCVCARAWGLTFGELSGVSVFTRFMIISSLCNTKHDESTKATRNTWFQYHDARHQYPRGSTWLSHRSFGRIESFLFSLCAHVLCPTGKPLGSWRTPLFLS